MKHEYLKTMPCNGTAWQALRASLGLTAAGLGAGLVAGESGWNVLSTGTLTGALALAAAAFFLTLSAGLRVRIGSSGLGFRFFPWHRSWQNISWDEMRLLRLEKDWPAGFAPSTGAPSRDFTKHYFLVKKGTYLRIELVNGHSVFLSVSQPEALAEMLRYRAPLAV